MLFLTCVHLTDRSFRVFSLDRGRLNLETCKFFNTVEKYYGVRIEKMFPNVVKVQGLVRSKGLPSFYEDGYQEYCRVRERGETLEEGIERVEVPIVQVDPSFKRLDSGVGSLVKWDPVANVQGMDIWNFLRAMNVSLNSLHSKMYISIGCEPCTRSVLPG
ncbi:hypothetical protein PVL29_022659 [Vitis rotundifolia]|uniref:Phosphoadenosine phosphosulphate reductase domain-containing protein n=1 Tax=Vitis rotundifolia TaxID=103349 RepID=A0AA38YW54_VITRO|nr:hypothetical protein PVL29_022659 [Vitis rotundifolia]